MGQKRGQKRGQKVVKNGHFGVILTPSENRTFQVTGAFQPGGGQKWVKKWPKIVKMGQKMTLLVREKSGKSDKKCRPVKNCAQNRNGHGFLTPKMTFLKKKWKKCLFPHKTREKIAIFDKKNFLKFRGVQKWPKMAILAKIEVDRFIRRGRNLRFQSDTKWVKKCQKWKFHVFGHDFGHHTLTGGFQPGGCQKWVM